MTFFSYPTHRTLEQAPRQTAQNIHRRAPTGLERDTVKYDGDENWVYDHCVRNGVWLNGLAGTGKTTIPRASPSECAQDFLAQALCHGILDRRNLHLIFLPWPSSWRTNIPSFDLICPDP